INADIGDDTIRFNLPALPSVPAVIIDGGPGDDTLDLSARPVLTSVIRYTDGSADLVDGTDIVRVRNVEHFFGAQTILSESGLASWLEQGPGPVRQNADPTLPQGSFPYAGAVEAIAVHPANENILFVGTVNGGVWRSEDRGATWTPVTDQFPS